MAMFYSQVSLPVEGLGCSQLSCWARGSRENLQSAQTDTKTKGWLLSAN